MKRLLLLFIFVLLCSLVLGFHTFKGNYRIASVPTAVVAKQNLIVEIKTVGELEAARSTIISSSIKGDQGKIINLIPDGVYVQPGEILVKMDSSPFENKLENLRIQIKEQKGYMSALEQALEWERSQAEHKNCTAEYEIEIAKLELEKIVYGDGPQEIARLKAAMQKALQKYEELKAYTEDVMELEAQALLNHAEAKQAQKKLDEEKEAYDTAKLQHENYLERVFPMLVKKAETNLKRTEVNQKETAKLGLYNIAKATALLEQAKQGLAEFSLQYDEAQRELAQTEIVAPAPGMVVHREDYRSGQKRKPRVGDVLVKNQPLIDLPDLSSMVIKTRVREVDLFKIGIGKKATIAVEAYPQLTFEGTITSIGVLAVADFGRPNDDKYFEVRISLDKSDPVLRPGMTARATIHAQQAENILTIPLYAIFDEQKQTYCYLVHPDNKYEIRSIVLGISNEQWTEVKQGLQEGDCVCLLNPFAIAAK